MSTKTSSAYETFHFVFGLLLAFCQPILLHRAWSRLRTGEFLFLFVVDQFLLLHFYLLPPNSKLPKQEVKREVIQFDPTDDHEVDDVKPIQKEWNKEDFQSLKAALQQMESAKQ